MSPPAISAATPSVTFSQVSVVGAWPFAAPDGKTPDLSGVPLHLVNLSARQAVERGLMIKGTSGRQLPGSPASVALHRSLVSRLQAILQNRGSTLYKLTWKPWDTPLTRYRFRLRASARRTSETGHTGWPTPTTRDWKDGSECKNVPINSLLGRTVWLVEPGQMLNGSDAQWVRCRDGKLRPIKPSAQPLADGVPSRVVRIRAYGNAINIEQAEAFIRAFMHTRGIAGSDLDDLI